MTSTSDTIASTIESLLYEIPRLKFCSQPISDVFKGINDQIVAFEQSFRFLAFLVDWNHKFSDAEVVEPHLIIKIEATMQEIAKQLEGKNIQQFRKKIEEIKEDGRSIFFQEMASGMLDVFTNLNAKIDLLKPEIREACQHLSAQSFQPHCPIRALDDWRKLVDSIYSVPGEVRQKNISALSQSLCDLPRFLDGLSKNPKAQEMIFIHVADVAIHAALVSCQWWASQFDPDMDEDVSIALLDLQRKIEFTDPESLDLILRQLKTVKAAAEVGLFIKDLLPFRRRFEEFIGKSFQSNEHSLPFTLIKELESLTVYFVEMTEEGAEHGQILPDVKLLILEIESFSHESLGNGTLLLNLLGKIWLIKIEIFLREQLSADRIFRYKWMVQIKALKKGVKQIEESPEEHIEYVNQILALMEEAAKLVAYIDRALCANSITKHMVRSLLHLLLLKNLLFKVGITLHNNSRSSMFFVKDRVQSSVEGLKFLINVCINQPGRIVKDSILEVERTEPIAKRVVSLYHSLLTHNIAKEMIDNMDLMLSDLLDGIKCNMAKLREIYLCVPRSNFPRTNAVGLIDSLLSKLRVLLNDKVDLVMSVKQYIEEILGHLEFFRDFLGDILEPEKEIEELRDLSGHVIDVAYEAEYIVDSIVTSDKSECHNLIWLYHLLQNIRHMKMQVTKVNERKTYDVKVQNVPRISRHAVSTTSTPRIDGDVLSLKDQQELIIDRLVGGYPQRDIVPIVGMPGIGKTTLAKKVYSNPKVAHHFHIRAWCCVTEVYRKRELLLEILSHIIVLTDSIRGMSNEDLDFKLRQLLLKQKYLIVMDNMWNSEAWDDLRRSFPDDGNGSRILITSRLDLALKAGASSNHHHLRLLSDAESWDLLQMKIFHGEHCPAELIELGKKIAKNCKGLPLSIVAMAGVLERVDRHQNQWNKIAENLNSRIIFDPEEQCRDILELSYKLLPDYLKACFLYFGAFLEDQEILVRKLMQLWVAEGLVQKTKLKSQEDLAEDYLMDLIGRSLVIFAQPRSRGGTKACRVHDMLRNLCRSKAKEENFLRVITRPTKLDTSFDDLHFVVNVNVSNPTNYITYEDHRLCFHSKRKHFVESRPFGPHVRSLLLFATSDNYPRCPYDISFISHNFRFLKVLDLEFLNMGTSFPTGIELLVHLRYLAVCGDIDSIPSSIANLWNLETFIVKGLKGLVNLPETIWCLKRVRHVRVSNIAIFSFQDHEHESSSQLDNLVTLSTPFLSYGEDTKKVISRFPNLQKLACIFSESSDCSGVCNHFPRLDVLTRLESLKISYYGRSLHNAEFSFPLSLKKLTLSNFRLPWNHISVIGRSLENLEVLKLLSEAFDGERWNVAEGEFSNLKFLKLDTLNIAKWNAANDHFPKLQQLVLRNCKHLEEVPSSFGEISTLQMIEVQWCGESAEESARRMREEVDEYLKVIITSDLESRLT